MNKTILIGTMCSGVDLKTTQSGISMASFRIAVRRKFKNAQGEYESDFLTCKAFRQTADYVSKNADKGSRIAVEGSIQTGSYEARDGSKRYTTDIIVESAEIIKPPRQDNDGFQEVQDDKLPWEE